MIQSKPEDKSSGHGQGGNLPSEDGKPEHTPKKGDKSNDKRENGYQDGHSGRV